MEKFNSIPSVCIVGRPNVGKSSLFNWLVGERRAVVVEQSGTTRDRLESVAHIDRYSVKIVDTGGYMIKTSDEISAQVKEQLYLAIEESTFVVMVTDAINGIVPSDQEVAAIVRKAGKPVMVVANKADNKNLENSAMEFYQLGFGDPLPVSCMHRKNIERLKEMIIAALKGKLVPYEEEKAIKIAVVGRPNVGKSSFINSILSKERVIVSDIPGTTRDSIDTFFVYDNDNYILIDTAGMRHKRKIKTVVDTFSMMRSEEAIKRADVVFLLLDSAEGITRDDMAILDMIEANGKAGLIVVNKWDLADEVRDVAIDEYRNALEYACARIRFFPIHFASAKTGKGVMKTLSMAKVLDTNLDIKVPTPFLNKLFEKNDPSVISISRRCKRPNFLYITQICSRPVEFSIFVNDSRAVQDVHRKFIENLLRDNLPLKGIPIRLKVKKSRKD